MGSYEFVCSCGVFVITPAFGEGEFLFRCQHRKLAYVLEVPGEISLGTEIEDGRGHG